MSEANALNQDQKPVSKFASLPKWRYASLVILSVMLIAFQLYIALVRPFDKWIQVPVHLCLALAIAFIHKPVADKCKTTVTKALGWAYDIFMLAGVAYCAYYFISNLSYLQNRIYNVDSMTTADLLCAYWLLIIVMEAVRRFMGMNLFIFICVFIAYAFLGQKISGIFKFRGMSWQSFGEVMVMDPNGILGSPLSSSVNTLFYFLLFGAFFSVCGGGQVLIDLGMKLSDKTAGGPAKASVVSSGLMGMISGSAVANVTSTGVMTIPLMKKSGYEPHQAGAIEAVASTGGQIMPPIMGVGAFIMAEMIGISYTRIAMAAIIPALAYYGSVFLLVHFLAKKKKMNSHDEAVVCKTAPIMPRIYQLAPIIVLVVMIFMGSSLTRAALVGSALAIIVSFISKDTRMNVSQFIDAMLDGTKQAYGIAIPTAACGIMTGIVVQSGVANKLTKIIAATGSSSLALALIITMLGCMLLGMALPTVAAYLIANILFCSTLISLGIDPLPANMFIFYFGVIAQITPPVCLASFTAAGIAGASSWKTGWTAVAYALVSFLTPYVFVFHPALLLQGTVTEVVVNTAIMAYGIIFLAGGIAGYMFVPIKNVVVRVLLACVAVFIIIPENITTLIGIPMGLAILVYFYIQGKKHKEAKASASAAA